jgi:hypothetical protein
MLYNDDAKDVVASAREGAVAYMYTVKVRLQAKPRCIHEAYARLS